MARHGDGRKSSNSRQTAMPLKAKLDALRTQGYTASGYIRSLLERELNRKGVIGHGCQAA